MELHSVIIQVGLICLLICKVYCMNCDRMSVNVLKPKNINDIDRYMIAIHGNPKSYAPGQRYNVSLKLSDDSPAYKKFKWFILTAEFESSQQNGHAGKFDIVYGADEVLATFSKFCPNTIVETSEIPKTEVQVYWTAPPRDSGCIVLKATVIESRESWFSEHGRLTRRLCEESEDQNVQPERLEKCCACSEAKYEVAFEGTWTRNTHPRHYPSDVWSTKFSDIIGASHARLHSFWKIADYASDGLKELMETESIRALESELKEMSQHIRTIIKARSLQYPNITQSTYSVFRVDSTNHRVSLVSKIIPSPDWFVGVSDFELCRSNCTWLESYTYNLYPIDTGTDDRIGYTSPDPPNPNSIPRPILEITENNPNDPRSPFFSEEGERMNPIAKLHFTRQRLYDKPCEHGEDEDGSKTTNECLTTKWTPWTRCTSICGPGISVRTRNYTQESSLQFCQEELIQMMECVGDCNGGNQGSEQEEDGSNAVTESVEAFPAGDTRCALGNWTDWSLCSTTCGNGTKTRFRQFRYPEFARNCEGLDELELLQSDECIGDAWGEWSACKVEGNEKCGKGYSRRMRLPVDPSRRPPKEEGDDGDEEMNEEDCPPEETMECEVPCEEKERGKTIELRLTYYKRGKRQ
ncbi:unnamed protein product [Acanthoscelides obtectus]|uniref:Spondin-1 n=1 Tax=Acanthoscelides obtectus TaxID=200917 RepID=A0A9P0JZH3_ACAOB|nr:unnamed protein product [Acanthoscelides obtectus]CAK1647096.1 Spondin-1 [Acanthoscelides obtectus]